MKRMLILCVVALCSMNNPTTAQTDAKAKSILEAVSKKISGLKSLKANFALHLMSANGKTKQSKTGSFFMKGTKYRVSLGDQEIICDNKTVWTYVKATNEVQVSNYNPSEQTLSPTKLFTNFYDKEYRYKYLGNKSFNGKSVSMIELLPTNSNKQFSKVELAVDASNTIVGGNVYEKNGNQYKYEVSGFTPNAAVNDAQFMFNAKQHPGVEVVDLR
ncbi:MAG: outer membrane lipoprotein carrier protein LolA [Bacteroidetes bacterium]|nr:outer membrane lipoprotein carrier protein LolA [Bacteroidota bacterium]MBS1741143.1 outer membrane lipoprotein carrier protein LolA [Bacteroidota bacterium]MBS1776314.1 outer membrane lipoprotein carrier protein LolA [Bacteroidota bacterium]